MNVQDIHGAQIITMTYLTTMGLNNDSIVEV